MKQHPAFIGIGGSFCGWSELRNLLTEHPQIVDELNALNYFNSKLWRTKDTDWYLAGLARTASPTILTGEVSVSYLYHPVVPERIVRAFPDTKLIAVVRHPLARAIAEYQYYKTLPRRHSYASCHEFMLANPGVVERGKYGAKLERYFSYYSPLEIQVVIYEDIVKTPLAVAERLYRWLDIDPTFVPKRLFAFTPPEEPLLNPSHLTKLKLAIKQRFVAMKQSQLKPWQPPQPKIKNWFTPEEEAYWTKEYWPDAVTLSDLVWEDMTVRWFESSGE